MSSKRGRGGRGQQKADIYDKEENNEEQEEMSKRRTRKVEIRRGGGKVDE